MIPRCRSLSPARRKSYGYGYRVGERAEPVKAIEANVSGLSQLHQPGRVGRGADNLIVSGLL